MADEKVRTIGKSRTIGHSIMFVLAAVTVGIYLYSDNVMRLIEHGRWYPPRIIPTLSHDDAGNPIIIMQPEFTDVADLGVEALQPSFVAMFNITVAVLFASMIAIVMERSFREQSFGTWSRFAILWVASFLGYVWVVAAIM